MASIIKDPNGTKRISFTHPNGGRKSVRLGKMSIANARTVKARIESLLSHKISGKSLDSETAAWVRDMPNTLADKLSKLGLIEHRGRATLGAFMDAYIKSRVDVKPATRLKYISSRKALADFFGEDKPLRAITEGDADEWRLSFTKRKSAENTIRKHTAVTKLFFGAAVKKKLIHKNPFAHLKATILPNRERFYFVTREEIQKVLDACPNAEWRLIVALARYGGLRCPSETLSLTWRDIDWERGRMRVWSPKTEHHTGGESRIVPIFPELRPYLDDAYHEAEPKAKFVIANYRDTGMNLRSRLLDIIWAAGLKEWPKLFQNLKSTRETELVETFPVHVVCSWIGNSEPVAAKHYLQTTTNISSEH